jgi:hypothetical protein
MSDHSECYLINSLVPILELVNDTDQNYWAMYYLFVWHYLYRAVDTDGNTIDFMLVKIVMKLLRKPFLQRQSDQVTCQEKLLLIKALTKLE